MPILNYTTKIKAEKTVGEIQVILGKAGAQAVMVEYDDNFEIEALSFRLNFTAQMLMFRMPARIDRLLAVMKKDKKIPNSAKNWEQANRVGWRIIKSWIEAQLALVECDQADMVEVFLPYAQNPNTGKSMYEQLEYTTLGLLEEN